MFAQALIARAEELREASNQAAVDLTCVSTSKSVTDAREMWHSRLRAFMTHVLTKPYVAGGNYLSSSLFLSS
jgi:hypothetical protein